MESIMRQIMSQGVWDDFLAHRLRKGRFTWHSFEEADEFVDSESYLPVVSRLSSGEELGIPFKTVINKMGTGKKRVVYHFGDPEMTVLKLISHLLYRYDGLFASNCYAFRRGKRASDAIFKLKRERWTSTTISTQYPSPSFFPSFPEYSRRTPNCILFLSASFRMTAPYQAMRWSGSGVE